ncbi:MAG: cytidylate kinase family protein [Candidatus Aenigmarchaeota archaeon]|nr:cytidylate kinase family protein [Candidatus Aenigmarchaeota archaeon]
MVVIAISGQPGCGSTTTGRLLAKKLGLGFFSAGEYFKSFSKGKTQEAVDFFGSEKGSSKDFHHAIDKLMVENAKKGNIAIDGKLAIHFLNTIADVKIWLKARVEKRAERYAKRDGVSIESAARTVKEKDDLERKTFKSLYGFDTFSQEKEADIVIDTSDKTPEQTVSEIMVFAKRKV